MNEIALQSIKRRNALNVDQKIISLQKRMWYACLRFRRDKGAFNDHDNKQGYDDEEAEHADYQSESG